MTGSLIASNSVTLIVLLIALVVLIIVLTVLATLFVVGIRGKTFSYLCRRPIRSP